MPGRLERHELSPRCGDAACARRVGKGHHAVGVADVEGVADERHAEGLVLAVQKHLSGFRHAVAIGVAQQRDAVGAHPHGVGASHRGDHGVVEDRPRRAVRAHGLGDQHVAIGQHLDPAGMIEADRKGVDREPGRRGRRLARAPSPGCRHLQGRDAALRSCRRYRRRTAPGRLGRAAGQPPHLERGAADHGDSAREKGRKTHGTSLPLSWADAPAGGYQGLRANPRCGSPQ